MRATTTTACREDLLTTPPRLARPRTVSRISLVKPQKAQGITNLIIQMAQSGQIRQRINEAQLVDLLEQVERGDGSGGAGPKITVSLARRQRDASQQLITSFFAHTYNSTIAKRRPSTMMTMTLICDRLA